MGAVGISGESPRDTLERLEWVEHMEGYFINVSGTSEYIFYVGKKAIREAGDIEGGTSPGSKEYTP